MATGTKSTLPYEDDPYDLNAGIVANEAAATTGGRTPTFSRTPYTGPGNPNMGSGPRNIYEKYGWNKADLYRQNQARHDAKYGRGDDGALDRQAAFDAVEQRRIAQSGQQPVEGQGGHQYGDPPTGPGSGGEYPGTGGGGYPYGNPGTPPGGGGEYPGGGGYPPPGGDSGGGGAPGGGDGGYPGGDGQGDGGLMDTLSDYQTQAEEF